MWKVGAYLTMLVAFVHCSHAELPCENFPKPRCGEVVNSNQGSISYKTFEPIEENERCVWIISAPKALAYVVDVLHLGDPTNNPGGNQDLVITGIRYDGPVTENQLYPPLLTSIMPTDTGTYTFNNTNIILVTFMSSESNGTGFGFALQFEAISTGEGRVVSLNTTHHLIQHPNFDFDYPPHSPSYDNNELAAFVFLPQNNIYSGNKALASYKGNDRDVRGGVDAIYAYKFRAEASSAIDKWKYTAGACLDTSRLEISVYDLALVILKTNANDTGPQLRLHYVGCS